MIALTTTSIAWLLFTIILGGWVVYAVLNLRQARDEIGSEIELAANRKPYFDDETLEGPRLTRVLGMGVILLVIIVVALPLYWILEPNRQAGAQEAKEEIFVEWGARLYAPTAEGGFNCAGCHGASGGGGVAAYNITDPATGETTAVNWIAPAVNTVFYRFDEDEVRFILVYGRPFSPMSPWGLDGGGPMNDQQIDTLIAYLHSIQIHARTAGRARTTPARARPVISRATSRPTSTPGLGSSWTRTAGATARRSSTSTWPVERSAAPGATRRDGAGVSRASPAPAASAGTSPVVRSTSTSRWSPT